MSNPRQGRRITTLRGLCKAALLKRALLCSWNQWSKPIPAAFVQNLQGVRIHDLLERGVYIYELPKSIIKYHKRSSKCTLTTAVITPMRPEEFAMLYPDKPMQVLRDYGMRY